MYSRQRSLASTKWAVTLLFFRRPQVRDAGNLLTRAGFALPTVDVDNFELQYASPLEVRLGLVGVGVSGSVGRWGEGKRGASPTLEAGVGRMSPRLTATHQPGMVNMIHLQLSG
jgi:hypothetical protein